MPWAFSVLFRLVSCYIAKLSEQLRESHLFLRWVHWIVNEWSFSIRIVPKWLFVGDGGLWFEPVCLLVFGFSQSTFKNVGAGHSIVYILHVSGQLFHSSFIISCDLLCHHGGTGCSRHLLFKFEHGRLDRTELRMSGHAWSIHWSDHARVPSRRRLAELKRPLGPPLDRVYFLMAEAGLAHRDSLIDFPRHLLLEWKFGDVFRLGQRGREVVQKLEPMIVRLVQWKSWPLRLLIEIDEARRARLQLRLVISIHRAELERVETMIVEGLLALSMAAYGVESAEAISGLSIDVLLIFLREKFLVFPHLVQYAGASLRCWIFGEWRLLLIRKNWIKIQKSESHNFQNIIRAVTQEREKRNFSWNFINKISLLCQWDYNLGLLSGHFHRKTPLHLALCTPGWSRWAAPAFFGTHAALCA